MKELNAVEVISILSTIVSCVFYAASYQIKIGLEARIDKVVVKVGDKLRRQQDRNKLKIGLLITEINYLKNVVAGKPCKLDLDEIENSLPEEESDLS